MEEQTVENYLSRCRVIDKLQSTGEWGNSKIRRLVYAIFGTEDEWDDFIFKCSNEEIDQILIAQGFNLDELKAKFEQRLAEIRFKYH